MRRCATRGCASATTTSRGSPRTRRGHWPRGSRSTRPCREPRPADVPASRSRLVSMAASVVTLKKTVPTSCTPLAVQSMRPGSQVQKRKPFARAGEERVRRVDRLHVLQVRGGGEEDRADEERDRVGVGADPIDVAGRGARRRSTPSRWRRARRSTSRRRGAPTRWSPVRRRGVRPACGARREFHSTTVPSGPRKRSRVTKGPKPPGSVRSQPSGSVTYEPDKAVNVRQSWRCRHAVVASARAVPRLPRYRHEHRDQDDRHAASHARDATRPSGTDLAAVGASL